MGASGSDVDAAVAAATKAFKTGEWATASGAQRGRWLNKLADLLDGEEDERGYGYAQALAKLESRASGRPVSTVLLGDLPRAAQVFRCMSRLCPTPSTPTPYFSSLFTLHSLSSSPSPSPSPSSSSSSSFSSSPSPSSSSSPSSPSANQMIERDMHLQQLV